MWIELLIKRPSDEVDWEAMGKRPKKGTVEYVTSERLVWYDDIIWVERYEDGCKVQLGYENSTILVSNDYDELKGMILKQEESKEEDCEI